jgi:hypothetical protein
MGGGAGEMTVQKMGKRKRNGLSMTNSSQGAWE